MIQWKTRLNGSHDQCAYMALYILYRKSVVVQWNLRCLANPIIMGVHHANGRCRQKSD